MNKENSTSSELQTKNVASSEEIVRVRMQRAQTVTKKCDFQGGSQSQERMLGV
jgi:hypothetical protein